MLGNRLQLWPSIKPTEENSYLKMYQLHMLLCFFSFLGVYYKVMVDFVCLLLYLVTLCFSGACVTT